MKKKFNMLLAVSVISCCLTGCDQVPQSGGQPSQAGRPPVIVPDSLLTRRNFYVVFDGSGSMNEGKCAGSSTKVEVAKKAIKNFEKSLGTNDNLGLFVFDRNGVSERVPLASGDRSAFEATVDGISASGGTPLYQSIEVAFESLKKQMEKQLNYGEYHLVVVTDGEANDRDNGLIARINQTPVVIHTIGFCIGTGHSLNQPGKVYYADAQSPEAVKKGLQDVLAESEKFSK